MTITVVYDEEADAVYVTLAGGVPVRAVECDPGTLVDVDAAGAPIGVEVVRPHREWPLAAIRAAFTLDAHTRDTLASIAGAFRPLVVSSGFRSLEMALVRTP